VKSQNDDVKPIDLRDVKHQLITLPFLWLAAIFVAGWLAKPWLASAMGFVTVAQAQEQAQAFTVLGEQVNAHITEYRMDKAYIMIRNTERDLSDHEAEKLNTPAWRESRRELTRKVRLAHEYKVCLQDEKPNCNLIQRQIWQ
jgi:hypothetical protein